MTNDRCKRAHVRITAPDNARGAQNQVMAEGNNRLRMNPRVYLNFQKDTLFFQNPRTPFVCSYRLLTVGGRLLGLSSDSDGLGEVLEDIDGGLPADAGVGDTDTSLEAGGTLSRDLLGTLVEVGLDHDTNDAILTGAKLL
jgi:hypothetical protein